MHVSSAGGRGSVVVRGGGPMIETQRRTKRSHHGHRGVLSSLPSWVMCLVSHRYFCLFVFLLILRHCFTKLTMGIYLFLHTILLSVGDPTYREKGWTAIPGEGKNVDAGVVLLVTWGCFVKRFSFRRDAY